MKAKKWLSTAAALTLVGTVVAGCSGGASQPSSSTAPSASAAGTATPAPAPNVPQELKMGLTAEPPALDISKGTSVISASFVNAIYEGLYRADKDGKLTLGVAKDMPKISADGKTYTIELKGDTKWADGQPVKAQDFVYSFQRTIDPATKAQYSFMVAWLENGPDIQAGKKPPTELGVKALSDTTLEIKLDHPIPFFTELLAFPTFYPQRKDLVEKFGDKNGADADKVLGNGPFKMTEWNHEQNLTLVKNDTYWDAANVKLTKVTFNIVKDAATALNLYETKAIDYTSISGDNIKLYEGKPDMVTKPELVNAYLMFQQKKHPELANANIRKALTLAIDRKAYVDTILKNGSVPATGLVPNGTKDGNGGDFRKLSGDLMPPFDPAKAKEYLAKGLQELGISKLPKFKLMTDDTSGAKKSMEFILSQWKENLGYEAEGEPVPSAVRWDRSANHDFDIVVALWGADYNDPSTFLDMWYIDSQFNEGDWKNEEYTKLVLAAQTELDKAKRAKMLADAEKILIDDMGVGPLYFRSTKYLIRPNVKNLILSPFGTEWELKWTSIE